MNMIKIVQYTLDKLQKSPFDKSLTQKETQLAQCLVNLLKLSEESEKTEAKTNVYLKTELNLMYFKMTLFEINEIF